MDTLNSGFAGMFAAIAAIFTLGLTPRFARRFYPEAPGIRGRLAAPILFALLALASFRGMAVPSLAVIAATGILQIAFQRWRRRV